ncbi:sodium/nucleoside cotransporter 1-like, partial [Littorina saxatilis]|uniref:sodium/nucleoside cotransporter 1-like n=1 Tax=Littorina saxatilis TaxID=31220 RepID=UPI0038B5919B
VSANHLISASFMSAPAALAVSKLFYPSDTHVRKKVNIKDIARPGTGLVDAATTGAVAAIGVVSHILVTVIAFISLLAFVNATLEWFGERVGLVPPYYPQLTFQLICSYLLWPVVFLIGVPMQDCQVVARMLGIKIFINEFIAYSDLGHVRANRVALESHVANNGTWRLADFGDGMELLGTNTTLVGGVILPRSEMLATYALCGFSDLVALGIMSAALSTVAPVRRHDILQVAPRALISGVVACLLTAAMAGLVAEA